MTEYYVDTFNGHDANPGTSFATGFKRIEHILEHNPLPRDTICIRTDLKTFNEFLKSQEQDAS